MKNMRCPMKRETWVVHGRETLSARACLYAKKGARLIKKERCPMKSKAWVVHGREMLSGRCTEEKRYLVGPGCRPEVKRVR